MDWLATFVTSLEDALDAGGFPDKEHLHSFKQRTSRQVHAPRMPTDPELLQLLRPDLQRQWAALFRKKPMRSLSGVAIVAVMSSPAHCPHGKCVYCPGGPEVNAPQSYTGFEPSTMRAMRLDYDPYRIVRSRLGRLELNGHAVDKVELVVQGGTFPAREDWYQDWFVASLYQGLNDGPSAGDPGAWQTVEQWQAMSQEARWEALEQLKLDNESTRCRAVGLTMETKPDWCLEPHVDRMLRYGATRVELGIQTLDEATTQLTNRGHTTEDTRRSLQVCKDAAFKICAHMMPGLPRPPDLRTDPAMDVEDMRRLFAESDWRPDMLKIYPTLVVMEGETSLKKWYHEGKYTPLDTAAARDVVSECLQLVPEYCRVQRVDRDIPTTHVEAGVMNSNLRQLAEADAAQDGHAVRDIRAREAGRRSREGHTIHVDALTLQRIDYDSSGGKECFLSIEDAASDALIGFIRLRHAGDSHREETRNQALVRELKVYGVAQAIGSHSDEALQHQGHGGRLLAAAEEVAKEWGVQRIVVIAGVGVKEYYRRHGYTDLGPYVSKSV